MPFDLSCSINALYWSLFNSEIFFCTCSSSFEVAIFFIVIGRCNFSLQTCFPFSLWPYEIFSISSLVCQCFCTLISSIVFDIGTKLIYLLFHFLQSSWYCVCHFSCAFSGSWVAFFTSFTLPHNHHNLF